MPTIPFTNEGPRVLPLGGVQVSAPAGAFGATQAAAMRQAGQDIARGGAVLGEAAARVERQDQVRRRSALQADMISGLTGLSDELRDETDPDKLRQRWADGTAALRQRLIAAAGAPLDQEWIGQQFQVDAARQGAAINQLARVRTRERDVATLNEGLFKLGQAADSARDGAGRAQALEAAQAQIAAAAEVGTIGRDDAQRLWQQFAGRVDFNTARRLINENPGQARAFIERSPNLSADQRISLDDRLSAEIARQQARAEAALARRERQVAVGLQQVNGLLSAGFVNEDAIAALKVQARGTAYEQLIPRLEQDAREIGRFAALPTTQQVTRLGELDATLKGGHATEQDLALRQRLASIVQHQQQDLNQRGLARAVQDGVVPDLPQWNPTDPEVVRQYADASQAATAHYGRPVSMLTDTAVRQWQQQFLAAAPEAKLATVLGVANIADPAIRAATIQHIERARGEAGRMPAGTLVRIADMARNGGFEGQQRALQLLTNLSADVSDRAKPAGEAPEFRAALTGAQGNGVQGVRVRQAEITGDGRYAATVSRDMDAITRDATVRLTSGETSPSRAITAAQEAWNTGLGVVNRSGLAAVYFPASQANPAQVETGLRLLKEDAAALPTGPQSADAALSARQRATAARLAEWVNEGDRFSLVGRGAAGAPVVLRRATLAEITAAAAEAPARERAAMSRPRQAEQALERDARERRRAEQLVPVE